MSYLPTLTRFNIISKTGTRSAGGMIVISYEDLIAQGNEAVSTDSLSNIAAFLITGVNSTYGTLKVGTTAETALPWSSTNAAAYTIAAGTNIYWTPYDTPKGDLTAFQVVVKDVAGQVSTNKVDAVVRIDGISQTQANTLATGSVTISGVAKEGQVLTASNNLADANGIGKINYQWMVDGEAVQGATGRRFTLGDEHVGKVISVAATYVDASGFSERIDSAFTSPVANLNQMVSGSVSIGGTVQAGQTLTATPSITDGDGLPSSSTYVYKWFANGVLIPGASDATFTLRAVDVAKKITVAVSYTDLKGTQEVIASAESTAVIAAPTGTNTSHTGGVQILGNPAQGQTLSAVSTLADADGMGAVSYQWYATSSTGVTRAILGATGKSYTLTQSEADKSIKVVVTYTDGKGFAESETSASTAAVANLNFAATGTLTVSALNATTLQYAASNIADQDDIKSDIVYQWQANGIDIAGANGSTLDVTRLAGKSISVKATFVDGDKATEVIKSNSFAVTGATDVDAPILMDASTGATIGTNQVILTYSEALSTVTAGKTRFKVLVGGVENTVTDAKVDGTKVLLTLKNVIAAGETLTVSYTDPTAYNDTYAVQDLKGNDAASVLAHSVTNLVPGNLAPTIEKISATALNIVQGMSSALPDFVVSDLNNDDITVTLTSSNGVIGGLVDENGSLAGIQLTGKGDVISTKLANANFTATAVGSASIMLSATDGTNTTTATQNLTASSPATLTAGTVIDGYVAHAKVFADTNRDGILNWTDTNGNGRWDASEGEAWTTTDELGHYQFASNESGKTIVASGGTDTATKLAITSVLRAPSGSAVVTPLTTIVTALVDVQVPTGTPTAAQITTAKGNVMTALGLSGIDLATYDPIAALKNNPSDTTALAVQKTAVKIMNLLSSVVDDHGVLAAKSFMTTLATKINTAPSTVLDFANATTLGQLLPSNATAGEIDRLVRANTSVAGTTTLDGLMAVQVLTQGDFVAPKAGVVTVSGKDSSADRDFTLNLIGQEPGATVQFQASTDGTSWTNTTATQSGVAYGNHYYRALVVDAAGNSTLTAQQYVKVSADLGITPSTPAVSFVEQKSTSGVISTVSNGGLTNDVSFAVKVTATPGQTVSIYDNGLYLGAAIETATPGEYIYNASHSSSIGLWLGQHQLTAKANDEFGNFSAPSSSYTVTAAVYMDPIAGPNGPYVTTSGKTSFPDSTYTVEFHGGSSYANKYVQLYSDNYGYHLEGATDGSGNASLSVASQPGTLHFNKVTVYTTSGMTSVVKGWSDNNPDFNDIPIIVANRAPDLVSPASLATPTIPTIIDDQGSTTGNVLAVVGQSTDDRRPVINITSNPVSHIVVMDGIEKLDDIYVPNLLNVSAGTYVTGSGYTTVVLNYDQILSSTLPLANQFTVMNGASTVTVSSVSVSGKNLILHFTAATSNVTSVAYANATSADDSNAIQSENGYDAASFTVVGTLANGFVKTINQTAETYTYTPTADLTVGAHDLKVKAINAFTSAASATQTITVIGSDNVAPAAPVIKYVVDDATPFTGQVLSTGSTNDATPTLTISAEANSTVNVYNGTTLLGQAIQTSVPGTYVFTPNVALATGSYNFKATATDASLNTSADSAVYTLNVDATAPTAGTLSIVGRDNIQDNNFSLKVTGQEAGSTVAYEYSRDGGLTWIATSETLTNVPGDTYLFRAKVTDAVGNISTTSSVMAVVDALSAPDVHPLNAPVINQIAVDGGEYQGLLADGSLLSTDATPTVTITAEPGKIIKVYGQSIKWTVPAGVNPDFPDGVKEVTRGALLGTAVESGVAGSYTFTPSTALPMGTTGFMAMALDAVGNTSTVSDVFAFNVGYKDPANGVVVYLEGKDSVDDSGFNLRAMNTNGQTISFQRQYMNETNWSGLANDFTGYDVMGYFAYIPGDPAYNSMTRNYRVLVNGVPSTNSFGVLWDKTQTSDLAAPVKPVVTDVTDNVGNIQGTINWGGSTEDTTPTLRIVAEKGSTVRVFDGETLIGFATQEGDLNTRPADRQPLITGEAPAVFTFTPSAALAAGTHNFYVRVSDANGNSSPLSEPYQVKILGDLTTDSTAPAAPSVVVIDDVAPIVGALGVGASTNDKRPTFKIAAEIGSNVDVYRGNTLLGHAKQGNVPGQFEFTPGTDMADGIHELRITAADGSGNLSADTLLTLVVDSVSPVGGNLVMLNKANDADGTYNLVYSGQEAGASAVLERSTNGFVTTSAVDNAQNMTTDGTYQYRVKVTDLAGNVGYSNTISATVNAKTAAATADTTAPVFSSGATARLADYSGAAQIIYTAEASDGAAGTGNITYSLEGGVGQAYLLSIDPTTGNVTLPATPGLKRLNSYSFNVIATDEKGNASSKAVTVGLTGVTIYGVQAEGYQLTASVTDADGNVKTPYGMTFQWAVDGEEIAGADKWSFMPNAWDIGKVITVKASYTDGAGNKEVYTSAPTAPIADLATVTENTTSEVYQAITSFVPTATTWSLQGADASKFKISDTGEVSFIHAADYEVADDAGADHIYNVNVVATSLGLTEITPVVLKVADVATGMTLSGLTNVTMVKSATPQLIDTDVAFGAVDNLAGAKLVVSGLAANDVISVYHYGATAGVIGLNGTSVTYGGQEIGTTSTASDKFTVTFNAAATGVAVDALLESLTFANSVPGSAVASRTLSINVIDKNGADLISNGAYTELTGTNNPFNGFDVGTTSAPAVVDINGDGRLDLVSGNKDGSFSVWSQNADHTFSALIGASNPLNGIKPYSWATYSAPSFVDLNNDGKLDLVSGEYYGKRYSYLNNSTTDGNGLVTGYNWTPLTGELDPFDEYYGCHDSVPAFVDINGDGQKDMVLGTLINPIMVFTNDHGVFTREVGENGLLNVYSGDAGTAYGFVDLNNDGFLDVVAGGRTGGFSAWINTSGDFRTMTKLEGAANPFNGFKTTPDSTSPVDSSGGWSKPVFADLMGNGDMYMIAGNANGTFNVYKSPVGSAPQITVSLTDTGTLRSPVSISSSDAATVAENTVGSIYTATGTAGLTWSLEGADAGRFSINGSSGAISFLAAPDFEASLDANHDNKYEVTLRGTSASGVSTTKALAFTVTDVADTMTPQEEALYLINRFRADPQGELARIMGLQQSRLDAVDSDGTGPDTAIVRSTGSNIGDGTDWSANYWQNFLGNKSNLALTLDYFKVSPGDLMYQWDHLPAAGMLQPLQTNSALGLSATNYAQIVSSDAGLTADVHHVAPYSGNDYSRFTDAGYAGGSDAAILTAAENLAADFNITDVSYLHAGYVIDWGQKAGDTTANGLQDGAGHRSNMLSGTYTEAGIGQVAGWTSGAVTQVQHFGDQMASEMLWGYAWDENSGTNAFSLSEALANVTVNLKSGDFTVAKSTTTNSFGGYSMDVHDVANGSYKLEFVAVNGAVLQTINTVVINDDQLKQVNCVI